MSVYRVFSLISFILIFQFLSLSDSYSETRRLWIHVTQTKETARITYKRDGRYLKSGLDRLNHLLRDFRTNEAIEMDPQLFDLLYQVYRKSGSKRPIHVVSGYRSPKTNDLLRRKGHNVARRSQHLVGKAVDFYLPDVPVKRLQVLGLREHKGGVGYYKNSFVHLDTGSVRHWPPLSRRQLTRVFPAGRTIHLPSNKEKLRGYEVANTNLQNGLFYDGRQDVDNGSQNLIGRLFGLDNATPIDDDIEIALAQNIPEQQDADDTVYSVSLANLDSIAIPTPRPDEPPDFVVTQSEITELITSSQLVDLSTITGYIARPTARPIRLAPTVPVKRPVLVSLDPVSPDPIELPSLHEGELKLTDLSSPSVRAWATASSDSLLSVSTFHELLGGRDISIDDLRLGNLSGPSLRAWTLSPPIHIDSSPSLQAPDYNSPRRFVTPKLRLHSVPSGSLTTISVISYNGEAS